MCALLFVLMHIAGFNGAAAQTVNQQQCPASNPDLSISGCTAMILSGRETPGNLAEAFYNRGVAYDNKGQPDRAIEDYDQAIRLNPNHAKAFYNRGVAYTIKRQHDRAIEDFDHAIWLRWTQWAADGLRRSFSSGRHNGCRRRLCRPVLIRLGQR
jgi:tetratricopeptide (TPR) repeat protein